MHCLQPFGCSQTRRSTFRPSWSCCCVCGMSWVSPLSPLPPSDSCAGTTYICGSVCEPGAEHTMSVLCASLCWLLTQFSPGTENPGFLAWVMGSKHRFCPCTPARWCRPVPWNRLCVFCTCSLRVNDVHLYGYKMACKYPTVTRGLWNWGESESQALIKSQTPSVMSFQYVVLKQQNAYTKESISTTTTTLHPSSCLVLDHLEKSLDSILPVTQEAVEKRWVGATLVCKGRTWGGNPV